MEVPPLFLPILPRDIDLEALPVPRIDHQAKRAIGDDGRARRRCFVRNPDDGVGEGDIDIGHLDGSRAIDDVEADTIDGGRLRQYKIIRMQVAVTVQCLPDGMRFAEGGAQNNFKLVPCCVDRRAMMVLPAGS